MFGAWGLQIINLFSAYKLYLYACLVDGHGHPEAVVAGGAHLYDGKERPANW